MIAPDKQYKLIKHRGHYFIYDNERCVDVGIASKKDGFWEVKMFSDRSRVQWDTWTNCLSTHECVEILLRTLSEE